MATEKLGIHPFAAVHSTLLQGNIEDDNLRGIHLSRD